MCTMAINQELNGIELSFEGKPAEEIREAMKAAGFRWHRMKKLWYAKNTTERLALAEELSGGAAAPAQAPVAKKSDPVSKFGIKVGDILEDSWGYEQTNVEFYLVTKIISACKIEIVELGHIETETNSSMSGYVIPDPDRRIGDPIQKTVSQDSYEKAHGGWHVKISSCISLSPWDGQPCFQSSWY
ncbi:hypothetical protein [Hominiventricola aquisgranensis]|uniref:Uncharacterized protein n=1 Tax=Hominiventricola aquisgranensis TaxID=3133164 RepID=A0ABV1HYU1_9FIRM